MLTPLAPSWRISRLPVTSVPIRFPATRPFTNPGGPLASRRPAPLSNAIRLRAAGVVPPTRPFVWFWLKRSEPWKGAGIWVPVGSVPRKHPSRTKFWWVSRTSISYCGARFMTSPLIVTSSAATFRQFVAPTALQSISIWRTVFSPMLVGFVLADEPDCV
jgi:hypothetical protein